MGQQLVFSGIRHSAIWSRRISATSRCGFGILIRGLIGGSLLFCTLGVKQIQRAWDLGEGGAADVQIDHGGGQSGMAQEDLDSPDILACLQKMSGKAVPHGVDA